MKDLNDRTQELLAAFRESGYCTECWVNLNEEDHEPKCPLAGEDRPMSDLDQAREAVELFDEHGFDWKEARNRYRHTIAAARRFLALTETGQRWVKCEEHEFAQSSLYDPDICPGGWDGSPCKVVPVLVADYLTEEETK